jgi:hypothetical protein
MNDDKEQAGSQKKTGDLQPCCDGGSCCPSGSDSGGKNWKIAVFILIVVAAGAVLARSIIRKSDSSTEQGQGGTFAAIQPEVIQDTPSPLATTANVETPAESKRSIESPSVVNAPTKAQVSDETAPSLWGKPLDSLASLNKVTANSDAVFILLAADDQEGNQAAIKQIEAAAKTIQSNGVRISAFRLKQGAPNYANLTKQLSIPCVLAMVKGGGLSGVSADQIAETKLVQAFVAASRPSSGCCPPGSGASCP